MILLVSVNKKTNARPGQICFPLPPGFYLGFSFDWKNEVTVTTVKTEDSLTLFRIEIHPKDNLLFHTILYSSLLYHFHKL